MSGIVVSVIGKLIQKCGSKEGVVDVCGSATLFRRLWGGFGKSVERFLRRRLEKTLNVIKGYSW